MFRNGAEAERSPHRDSKLQAVLIKLTGVFPRAEDLQGAAQKTMSSDIIESVLADTPIPSQNWTNEPFPTSEDTDYSTTIKALSDRLETELRAAKRTHLSCGEVLLPCGLLQRIARDIFAMAESEPCGLRGCALHMGFESEDSRIMTSSIKWDPTTASTFELYLTLKLSAAGWNSFLPQFLRNLTKSGTVMISPAYTLSKRKLYRSYVD